MSEQPINDYQPRVFSTWIGMVLLLAFFGLLVLVIVGASPRGSDYESKRAKTRAEKLTALRQETSKALTTYAWVDKNKGVARIPVEEAMKLMVADNAQKKPASAYPIVVPAATPPATSAPAPASASVPPASTPGPTATPAS